MRHPGVEVVRRDVVVVGAGAAGLSAALAATGRRVAVLTAAAGGGGSSPLAQGGIAAAVGTDDDPTLHAADTIGVAGDLADERVVTEVTANAPEVISSLRRMGVRFDAAATDARPLLAREAGHSRSRVLHAAGDATGRELVRALWAAVHAEPRIEVSVGTSARRLVVSDQRVSGVLAETPDGPVLLLAPVVVLATGGVGGLFARTTNPPEVWGAGLALAARAGATVADVEFVQFHPTALAVVDGARVPLVTEALRGEGARLVDASGRPLLADVHPDGDLAPRDVAARALWRHLRAGGAAFLDARRQMARKAAFPTVRSLCLAHGIDPAAVPIPVAPAAHYHMGGVLVDADGRGDVPGLWACGEAAATGMHGANRLASNSLLEAVWGGRRVGAAIVAEPPSAIGDPSDVAPEPTEDDEHVARAVAAIAWEALGIERGHAGLSAALDRLDVLADRVQIGPARDRILVARLLATAALARTESRGAHQRADHPATDPAWRARILLTLEDEVITTAVAPLGDTGALVAGRDAVA